MKLGIPSDAVFFKINSKPDRTIYSQARCVKPKTPWQWYITQQKVMSRKNDLDPDFLFKGGFWKGRHFELTSSEIKRNDQK